MKTGAIILTAGISKVSKDDLIKDEVTTLRDAGVNPIVVVTGYEEEQIKKLLAHRKVIFARNPDYGKSGMIDSIRIGLRKLKGQCTKAIIVNGDIPSFTEETLRRLSEAEGDIAIPEYKGTPGHPFCLDMKAAEKIEEQPCEDGIRGLIRCGVLKAEKIEVDDPGILMEVEEEDALRDMMQYKREMIFSDPVRTEVKFSLARKESFFNEELEALLTKIRECGSMNMSCKDLGIAYSRGWKMIRFAEDMLGCTLVEKKTGGSGGGGSVLTEEGSEYLAAYSRMRKEITEYAERALDTFISSRNK